jgi:hypothetical protein
VMMMIQCDDDDDNNDDDDDDDDSDDDNNDDDIIADASVHELFIPPLSHLPSLPHLLPFSSPPSPSRLRIRQCYVQFVGCSDFWGKLPVTLNMIKYVSLRPKHYCVFFKEGVSIVPDLNPTPTLPHP